MNKMKEKNFPIKFFIFQSGIALKNLLLTPELKFNHQAFTKWAMLFLT